MNILAMETTGIAASAAIVCEEKTIAEFTVSLKKTHSQTIMPMLDGIFKTSEFDKNEIDYIACSNGPGSFTGLRIGVATAKGLAFGLNKKIVPVPTLDALAYNIFKTESVIVPIMDARRNQVYAALYRWENDELKRISDYMAEDINSVFEQILKLKQNAVFLGDGVPVHKNKIAGIKEFCTAPPHLNMQRAASIGAIALQQIDKAIPADELVPFYIRKSQAEREYEERNQ